MNGLVEVPDLGAYQVVNGTYYRPSVPADLIKAIERLRLSHTERGLAYVVHGDQGSGQAWPPDATFTIGRLGRSIGPVKVPLLIAGKDAGGPALLDTCIVRLARYPDGHVLWQHPTYQPMYAWASARVNAAPRWFNVLAPMVKDSSRVDALAAFRRASEAYDYIAHKLRYEVE